MDETCPREAPPLVAPIRYDGPGERRGDVGRWTAAMAATIAVHVLPVLFMIYWLEPTPQPITLVADPVIFVELAPPAAPPEPPSEQPPGPKRVEAEMPRPRLIGESARPPLAPPPLVLPSAPPEEVREQAREAEPETAAPASRPAPPAPPAPRLSGGQPTWEGLVLAALDRKKRFPREARARREQGVPWIRFVMDREGKVLSSVLERSSGFRSLDAEAVALPKRAAPLPKPPKGVGGETLELVVPIEFFMR